MKKFTSHGREAWRPLARNKGGGSEAHGARSTGREKLGRKSCYTSHEKNGRYFKWSQNFWRATKACWKALCSQVLRSLSSFLSHLLSLCKALPAWLSQGAWKLSSYLAPSADDATTDRAVEKCAAQKRATGRVPRKKLAKRTSALGAAKGTSYAGKATSSKEKPDAFDKKTVHANECIGNASTSCTSSASFAIEPELVSAGPEGDWAIATGRRGRNRVAQERLHSSREHPEQSALARREISGALSASTAVVESLKVGKAQPVATVTLPCDAAARASSFAPQNETSSARIPTSSTTVVTGARGDAENDKTVSCPPDQGTRRKTSLSLSAAAPPAAEGSGLCKAVPSNESFSSGHRLQSASNNEDDDGFTIATSHGRKPTARKRTFEFRCFNSGLVLSSDSAARRTGEAAQQNQFGSSVTGEDNRACFSRADSRTDCAASLPCKAGEKRLFPLQKGGVCTTRGATDSSVEKAEKFAGINGEECLEKKELTASECSSMPRIVAPHRLEQWSESSTGYKLADSAPEHLRMKNETGQKKVTTIPKRTSPVLHAEVQGTEVAQEKTQGEDRQKAKETAGGPDSFAATNASAQARAVEKHACAGEPSPFLYPVEEETAVPTRPVPGTIQTAVEEKEVAEKIQGRAQQQTEQPKRWGDRLSDEEDDVCSWGSRESVEKLTSCFPFTQIAVVSPNLTETRERTGTPLAAKQAASKTMPQRKNPGFRTTRGLHASAGEHGLSKRHDRQRGAQRVRTSSREQDWYQPSRAFQRAAEFPAFRTSKKFAPPAAQASRVHQEMPESLPRAETDAAACWPPLSNAVYVKARKPTAIPLSSPAASNLASPVEPFPRQRSSFRPDSGTSYSRRPQLQHAKLHPAPGAAAEVGQRGVPLRNGGNQVTTARVQGSSIWRVRDQQHQREVTAGDASRVVHTSATKMSGPCHSEPAGTTTQRSSQQQGSASFVEDQNRFKKGVTKFAPAYATRTDLSTVVLPPPGSVIPGTSTPKLSGGHDAVLGRAGRRRARYHQRRWDHYAHDSHSRESFHSRVQQQPQTTFYSYGVPPPPPPPPPPALAFYSTPRTYPSTGAHPYEGCTSHPVPPELVARGILLPHHQEQQQQPQLLGPLQIYSASGACYVPVPYSTPAALYEAQRQLEYRCAWVYPPATSVTSQTKAKDIELERGETGLPGRPHCESETVAADSYEGGGSQPQRKRTYNRCDRVAGDPSGQEHTQCEPNDQVDDSDLNMEGLPHGQPEEHQERRQWGQLPQKQRDNEEQIRYEQSRETKARSQGGCEAEAGRGQSHCREHVNDGEPVRPTERARTSSSDPEDEDCTNKRHPAGSNAMSRAVLSEDTDTCLRCDEIPESTTHLVQKCDPVVQRHQHRHRYISANSSPRAEEAVATPNNGTLSPLSRSVSTERTKRAVGVLVSADTAMAQVNEVASAERQARDYKATALCPAATELENMRDEEISDCLQHYREAKRDQVEAGLPRNEVAATIERTLADTLGTPPLKCKKNAESAVSRKSSGSLRWKGSTEADRKMCTEAGSARKTALSKDLHAVWAERSGCVTPSAQLEPDTNSASQLYVEPTVQPEKSTNADPEGYTQSISPERKQAVFDHVQDESAPQKEEKRTLPTETKSFVKREDEDVVSTKWQQHPAQGTKERERTEDTCAARVVPHKEEDSISAGEISQLPLDHKTEEELTATKTLQQCVQQIKEEESLPDITTEECAAPEKEAKSWTEKPSPQQGPRGEELLVQKESGGIQQRSSEEDRAVQQQTRRTQHNPHTKNEGKRVSLSTESGAEVEE